MANRDSGSSLGTLLAGAVIGAAGLAWWLFSESDRRQQRSRQERNLRLGRLSADDAEAFEPAEHSGPLRERELQDKVHQLNQAIDDVRRQLESLSTQGQG
ncbi:MAG: hypothetical protein RLZZ423_122 [Cyanobacteriota bacterium]|jgi:hypothetical protein